MAISTCACGSSSCQVFQSKDVPEKSTSPEEFTRMTKGITIATAKAVAAGNSAQQEDVIATANLSRKAISDMLTTCKVLIHAARPKQTSRRQHQAAREHVSPACGEQILQRLVYCMSAPTANDSVTFQSHAAKHHSGRPSANSWALVKRQK